MKEHKTFDSLLIYHNWLEFVSFKVEYKISNFNNSMNKLVIDITFTCILISHGRLRDLVK